MIELPEGIGPAHAKHSMIDYGFLQRGALGAKTQRMNRKGNRFVAAMTFGPFYADQGSQFVARLLEAKSDGIRLPYPLQIDQGAAGSPVVDGAGQTGTTLPMKGLIPGYVCREGYWLSIENSDGQHYLHNVRAGGMADAAGDLSITINPELRHPFADEATVHLEKPMIEGLVDGDAWDWETSVNQVVPINFTVEEAE